MEYQVGQGLKEYRVCKVHQDTMAQMVKRRNTTNTLHAFMASVTSTLHEQDAEHECFMSCFPHLSH